MRKMLLSFKPEVYEKIKSGKKIFEHRRNFPDEPIMAYMYVSAPVKAITGIVYLGKRHLLSDWHEEFKDDKDAVARIEKYQESYRYAMEIDEFQEKFIERVKEYLHEKAPGRYVVVSGWCVFVMSIREARKRKIRRIEYHIVK